eukprot:TRINITY_DN1516_c0_g1_i2.p1 TRINITY_DN1516_c0_g1~~TRINITY_DN1516_c0_g1_i2.p1  ORF type:complete len:239 (+),score=23.54 TRINITY_DN1516_c0_g1_i2:115-831(+)
MASLSSPLIFTPRIPIKSDHHLPLFPIHPQTPRILSPLQASGRISNYKQEVVLVADRRNWSGGVGDFEDDGETDGDEEEDDRSLDLLVRFVHNVFRKVSRRARKAVRSVIPLPISTKLVGFSVNGVIILAFLWILKAFLEGCPTYKKAAMVEEACSMMRTVCGLVHSLQVDSCQPSSFYKCIRAYLQDDQGKKFLVSCIVEEKQKENKGLTVDTVLSSPRKGHRLSERRIRLRKSSNC